MIISVNEKNFQIYCNEILNFNSKNTLEYNQNFLNYLKEVYINKVINNKTFVVLQDKKPVALFLGIISKNPKKTLNMYSLSSTYFEGETVLNKSTKKLVIQQIENLLTESNNKINFEDFLSNGKMNIVSDYLLLKKAKIKQKFYKKIDLTQDKEIIWQSIRKSYKSLINWGERELKIELYDENNITKKIFKLYSDLHFDVVGKKTRSKKSWDIQYDLIKSKNCFLSIGKYKNKIVAGGLFFNNGTVCNYGASVSKREFFDKPIFHYILWKSILFAKKKNYKEFLISWGLFNSKMSKKEKSIQLFKDGFSGENQVTLNLTIS